MSLPERAAVREDLVQDVILELREGLGARYDANRGRFRAFLCGVVRNKVREHRRRRAPRSLDAIAEPAVVEETDADALDLLAEVTASIRRWHDRWQRREPLRVYVLSGRIVAALSYSEIARREGISRDAVKRILAAAREDIVADLLAHTLAVPVGASRSPIPWTELAGTVRELAGAGPRSHALFLARLSLGALREPLAAWLDTLDHARLSLANGRAKSGQVDGCLEEIFGAR